MTQGHMIFGLGSGRSGTASLGGLINAQPGAVCFHEINPSAMAWQGAEGTVISLLRDFRAILEGGERALTIDRTSPNRDAPVPRMLEMDRVQAIGDVGHYYLPYVETILEREPNTRFPCFWRAEDKVVESFTAKMRLKPHGRMERLRATLTGNALPTSRNHWAGAGDDRWRGDLRFDACFPSYDDLNGAPLADHLRRWHQEYYAEVERLVAKHPDHVRIFDLERMNSVEGRREILEFALPGFDVDPDVEVHANHRAVTL